MDNKKTSLGGRLASSEAFLSVVASLICIVIGLLLGVVVLAIINAEHAFGDGLLVILQSGIKSPRNMGTVLANAAPLIMTGLSVGFAFKTGLFNIGAAGQYTLGAFGALYCAIVLQLPWYVCLLAAMLLGAVWGAIPGLFKAYLNINEVITAIMTNWIGLYMVNDIMYGKGQSPMYDLATTKTYSLRKVAPGSMIPSCGMSDHFGMMQLEEVRNRYLGGNASLTCSAQTAAQIDEEVRLLIRQGKEKATKLITAHLEEMQEAAAILLQKETITGEEFMQVLKKHGDA